MEITIKNGSNYAQTHLLSEGQRSLNTFSFGRFYNWGLALAESKGCNVRNCYLCKYRNYDFDNEILTCELKPDEACEAEMAKSCSKYILDEDYYHKHLREFSEFSQDHIVDVWSKT